jgi:hypothetical protein
MEKFASIAERQTASSDWNHDSISVLAKLLLLLETGREICSYCSEISADRLAAAAGDLY